MELTLKSSLSTMRERSDFGLRFGNMRVDNGLEKSIVILTILTARASVSKCEPVADMARENYGAIASPDCASPRFLRFDQSLVKPRIGDIIGGFPPNRFHLGGVRAEGSRANLP